jgi:hypothetical protein
MNLIEEAENFVCKLLKANFLFYISIMIATILCEVVTAVQELSKEEN